MDTIDSSIIPNGLFSNENPDPSKTTNYRQDYGKHDEEELVPKNEKHEMELFVTSGDHHTLPKQRHKISSYATVSSDPTDFFAKEKAKKLTTKNLKEINVTAEPFLDPNVSLEHNSTDTMLGENRFYQFRVDEGNESAVFESSIQIPVEYKTDQADNDHDTEYSCDKSATSQGTKIQKRSRSKFASSQNGKLSYTKNKTSSDIIFSSQNDLLSRQKEAEKDSFCNISSGNNVYKDLSTHFRTKSKDQTYFHQKKDSNFCLFVTGTKLDEHGSNINKSDVPFIKLQEIDRKSKIRTTDHDDARSLFPLNNRQPLQLCKIQESHTDFCSLKSRERNYFEMHKCTQKDRANSKENFVPTTNKIRVDEQVNEKPRNHKKIVGTNNDSDGYDESVTNSVLKFQIQDNVYKSSSRHSNSNSHDKFMLKSSIKTSQTTGLQQSLDENFGKDYFNAISSNDGRSSSDTGSYKKPLALPSNAIVASMLFRTHYDINKDDVDEKLKAHAEERKETCNYRSDIPDAVTTDHDYMTTVSSFSDGTSAYMHDTWKKPSRDLLNYFSSARAFDSDKRYHQSSKFPSSTNVDVNGSTIKLHHNKATENKLFQV
jgi:hypothetical protein